MKNFKFALGVLLSLLVGFAPAFAGNGRQVGTPTNPDAVSWYGGGCDQTAGGNGITGCEVAIDYFGNLQPTVTNTQTLGTASLVWSNVYSQTATVLGNDVAGTAGSTPVAGSTTAANGTAATQSSIAGLSVIGPRYAVGSADSTGNGVTVSTIIPVNASFESVIGVGAVTLTSKPNISTTTVVGGLTLIPDGTQLIITSSATATDAVVFQSSGNLTGSQLRLGAGTRSVFLGRVLTLIFDRVSACWLEQGYE